MERRSAAGRCFSTLVVVLFFLPLALTAPPSLAGVTTLQLEPTDDSYVHSGNPTTNYGLGADINVGLLLNTVPSQVGEGYLQFDLAGVPPRAIVSATLHMKTRRVQNPNPFEGVVVGKVGNDGWDETTIHWNNAPGFTTGFGDPSILNPAVNQWYSWDVKSHAIQVGGDGKLSLGLRTGFISSSLKVTFYSKDSTFLADHPYLELVYEDCEVPDPVTGPAPFSLYFHDTGTEGWGQLYTDYREPMDEDTDWRRPSYGYDLDLNNPYFAVSAELTGDYSGGYHAEMWLANNYADHTNQVRAELWTGPCDSPTSQLGSDVVTVIGLEPVRYDFDLGQHSLLLNDESVFLKIVYLGPNPGDTHIYWDRAEYPSGLFARPYVPPIDFVPFVFSQPISGVERADTQWGDVDGDGDLDMACSGYSAADTSTTVYENRNGDMVPMAQPGLIGVYSTGAGNLAWADYDRDGDLDLTVTGATSAARVSRIYLNDGAGNLSLDTGQELIGVSGSSVAWADYDLDRDLDLYLQGGTGSELVSVLYENRDGFLFPDTEQLLVPVASGSADWVDFDGDGDFDLVVTGSDGVDERVIFYENDPVGTLTAIGTGGVIPVSLSDTAWGDIDNDGDMDLAITGNPGTSPYLGRIYTNDGSGNMTMLGSNIVSIYRSSCALGDYDNDGLLDVVFSGYTSTALITRIYRNTGSGFTQTFAWNGYTAEGSVSWADVDGDGDLDFCVVGGMFFGGTAGIIFERTGGSPNIPPSAPTGLTHQAAGFYPRFSWDDGADPETPVDGLYYALRVGITPGGHEVISGLYGSPLMGTVGQSQDLTFATIGGVLYWSVRTIDAGLRASEWAPEQTWVTVGTDDVPATGARLFANVPNPFNPGTRIEYSIPEEHAGQRVLLRVFDLGGRLVATLIDEHQEAGLHWVRWNGTDADGKSVASGVYAYELVSGADRLSRRMTLIK